MKRVILSVIFLIYSGTAAAEYVYCSGKVQRVQIENGSYMVWLGDSMNSSSIHELGGVLDPLIEKYFSISLTAYATQDTLNIRYTNPGNSSCSHLRSAASSISYVTMFK